MKRFLFAFFALATFVSCASSPTLPYDPVKGENDLSSFEEAIDTLEAEEIKLDSRVSHKFQSSTSVHIYFDEAQYRTTVKPYLLTVTEPGAYMVEAQTMLPAGLKTIVIFPDIVVFTDDKERLPVRKFSQEMIGPGLLDSASIVTKFSVNLPAAGSYYVLAACDFSESYGATIKTVDYSGNVVGETVYQRYPYGTYRITITKQ